MMNKSGGVSGNSDGKENEFSLRWLEDVFEQSKGYTGANEKNENKQQKDPKLIENMTKKEEIQRQTSNDILSKEMIHQPGNISTNNSDKDISPSILLHLLDDVIDQNENSTSGKNIACREISKETTKQKHTHETYIDDIINEITDTTTRLDKVKSTNSLDGQTLAQTSTEMATCQDRNAIFTGDENLGKARSGVENLKNRDNLLPSLKENSIEDRSNAPKLVKSKLLDSQLDAMDTVMKKTAHTEMKTPNVDVKDAILMAIETEYKDVNLDPNFRAMPTSLKDSAKNIDEMNVKTGQSSNQLITENNLIAQSLDGMIKDIQSNIDNNSNQKTKLILANEKCQKDVSETSSDNDHVGKLGTVQDSENQAGSDGKDDKSIIIDGSTQVASHHFIPDLSKLDLEGREEIDHDVRFLVDEINTDILDLDKTIVEGDATAQKIEERTDAFEKDKFKVNDSSNNEDRKCDTKLDLADTEVSGNKGKQKLVDQQSVHQDLTVESSNLSETLDNLLATDFDQSKINHDQKVSAKQQRKSIDKSKSVRHGQTQDFKARSINNSKGIVERHDRVRAKNSQEKISTKTNKLKGDQKVCMSSAEVVLLRQLGLQEKLLCMGFRADVKATGNQYTLMTNMNNPKAPREQLAAIKNSQDGISANLSAFLRQYSHLIDDINRILRNKRILAGVYLDNEAVFVIGINNEEYDKAVAFLKEQYQTKEFKLHYKKNLLEDWTNVHQYFTHKFAHYHRVFVDFCINTIDKTVNTTVVGVLNEIDYVVSKAKKYLMVYKGNAHHHTSFDDRFDEFVIGKMELVKVEFLQRFCNDDLMAIQNRYQCQVLFEANKGESSSEDRKVIIKYRHSQISTAISQIDAEILSIPVVCKSISVGKSQFSKILRYVISEKDKGKLANLKDSLQFSIDVADVQIRRITKENSKLRAPAWKKVNRGLRVTCPSLKYNNTSFSQQASSFTYLPSNMSSMLLLNKLSPSTFSSLSCNVPIIDDNQKIDFNGKVITVLKRPLQAISNNFDVIVNSIMSGNYSAGQIASALYQSGGAAYQLECQRKLRTLSTTSIGCTSGVHFGCQYVYHIPFLSSSRHLSWLKPKIGECLRKASKQSMQSMAIPAIGAGHVGIKAQDLAREMISTTCKYLLENADTSLNVIAFAILDQDIYDAYTKSIDAAQIELNSYCQESNFSTNQLDNGLVDQITKCKKIPGKIEEEKLDTLLTVTSESNAKLSCNFCFGVMHAVQTSAVINTTHICHLHQSEDHLSARLDSTVKNHCLESIHVDKSTQSGCSIFKVCPYGLIDDFGSLLACVNANENTSISCPLASTEITEEDIKLLIQAIYLFLDSHKKSGISLQRIDFITGNRELAYEIASWAQHQFENAHKSNSDYTIAWQITRPFSYNNFGKNVTIVASRYEIIEQIESLLASYAPSWTCVVFAEEDMLGYDEETWHALIQDWWCQHSTLMIRNTNTKQLQIYGYKNDIFTTYSNFQKSSSLKTYQSAMEENRKELLETVQWNVNIKQAVHQFDLVMNYQLEIDYQAYLNDKTKSNVILDGKSIDFIRMAITVDTGMSYPIWRKFALEDSLPASWQSAEADTQKDELKLIVEVRNQAEIQEISELVRAKGIDLIKLQRIQNRNLYRRYQLQKAEVTQDVQQYQPGTVIERRLFHRTNENNVNSICKSGFDRDYSGKSHESALGTGTYFATEPSTSVGYGRTLILARVLTGICNTSGNVRNLQYIPGSQNKRIHSVLNSLLNPTVFVIFNDNAAYPEYILHVRQ